tara:strand:- start:559 stop:1380 length:822 start_codon:yes stop_codon:yes gene_type:complete
MASADDFTYQKFDKNFLKKNLTGEAKSIYDMITKTIKPKLKKMDFDIYCIPVMSSNDTYDNIHSTLMLMNGKNYHDFDNAFVCKFIINDDFEFSEDKIEIFKIPNLNLEEKNKIFDIFEFYFERKFIWTGKNRNSLYLYLKSQKISKFDRRLLKEDDCYPILKVSMVFNPNNTNFELRDDPNEYLKVSSHEFKEIEYIYINNIDIIFYEVNGERTCHNIIDDYKRVAKKEKIDLTISICKDDTDKFNTLYFSDKYYGDYYDQYDDEEIHDDYW